MKKIYSRYGIASEIDPAHPVYRPSKYGGYVNTGYRVGQVLSDGRKLVMGRSVAWRTVWKTVYAVRGCKIAQVKIFMSKGRSKTYRALTAKIKALEEASAYEDSALNRHFEKIDVPQD